MNQKSLEDRIREQVESTIGTVVGTNEFGYYMIDFSCPEMHTGSPECTMKIEHQTNRGASTDSERSQSTRRQPDSPI